MNAPQELERVIVVLNEPQDPVNIGGIVRAMKNMGLSRLRLVRPKAFDLHRVEGVAHTGMDVIESAESFDSLADAVATAGLVVGTTARGRKVKRNYRRPREAAAEVSSVAAAGPEVALVFGREDRGLSNDDLDLCSRVVVIPTHPAHSSLNLAQALLILAYEVWLASQAAPPFKTPRQSAERARSDEFERLFAEVEESLRAIDFFKSHTVGPIMRTVRVVAGRADLDRSEVALLSAMAIELRKYLARHGVPPSDREE